MKPTPILLLLAGVMLFLWAVPGAMPEGDPVDGAAAGAPASDGASEDEAFTGELVLPRAGDGHFYAEVTVDGVSSIMLVDTGASVIALTGADARSIGIEWNPDEVRQVARGAGGPVHGVRVTLGAVRVGDFEAGGIEAVVVPEGLAVSLLGQSFLSRIERVEIGPDEMTLGG